MSNHEKTDFAKQVTHKHREENSEVAQRQMTQHEMEDQVQEDVQDFAQIMKQLRE